MITGQHDRYARKREFELYCNVWVIPMGVEYFFQPSISVLRDVLAKYADQTFPYIVRYAVVGQPEISGGPITV